MGRPGSGGPRPRPPPMALWPCPAAWPISQEPWCPVLLEPQQPALPSSELPRPPWPGRDPSTESSEAPLSPGGAASSPAPLSLRDPMSSGDSFLGGQVAYVTNHSQGSMSPCAPVSGACVTSCPSAPEAHVTLSPSVPGAHVTSCPHSYCPRHRPASWVPPIHSHTPSTRPRGRWLATSPCEGRRGSPSRESTRVPHLVTPVSRLGFSGAGGLWPGASALAGRRRPEATWLATQAPMLDGPRPIPCLLQRCLAQSWCAQDFGTLHPRI